MGILIYQYFKNMLINVLFSRCLVYCGLLSVIVSFFAHYYLMIRLVQRFI